MPRQTRADLEAENTELRSKLEAMYDDIGDVLGFDDDPDDDDEDDDEDR